MVFHCDFYLYFSDGWCWRFFHVLSGHLYIILCEVPWTNYPLQHNKYYTYFAPKLVIWPEPGGDHSCLLHMTLGGASWCLGVIWQLGLEVPEDPPTHSLCLLLILALSWSPCVVAWPALFQKLASQVQGVGTQDTITNGGWGCQHHIVRRACGIGCIVGPSLENTVCHLSKSFAHCFVFHCGVKNLCVFWKWVLFQYKAWFFIFLMVVLKKAKIFPLDKVCFIWFIF